MKEDLLESFSRARIRRRCGLPPHGGRSDDIGHIMRNRMECVRSRKTLNASIDAGYSHSVALCMNVAAIQTGEGHLRRQNRTGDGRR